MNSLDDASNEVQRQIDLLLYPSGDSQYAAVRGNALDYLLQHADAAHPRLLEVVEGDAPPSLAIAALPRFGRVESVAVLARLLHATTDTIVVLAARALAEHPRDEARTALEAALSDARPQVVASAAEGLASRGDRASCGALLMARANAQGELQTRIDAALAGLRCDAGMARS